MAKPKQHRGPVEVLIALGVFMLWVVIMSLLLPTQAHWDQVNGREPQTATSFWMAFAITLVILYWVILASIRLVRNGPAFRRRCAKPAKTGLNIRKLQQDIEDV